MNAFSAKKLGEVLAFARTAAATIERGQPALEQVFDEHVVADMTEQSNDHAERILGIAEATDITEAVMAKADGTTEKLTAMQDLYLQGDDWNDPAELLEWLGFFEGAALVHWRLVQGVASAAGESNLITLADDGADFHKTVLDGVGTAIRSHAEAEAA